MQLSRKGFCTHFPQAGPTMLMPRRLLAENRERDKIVLEKETFGTMQKLHQSWYETCQTVAQSTFDVQGRSAQYVQNVLTDGIETLKGHVEIARHLLSMANKPQEQQDPLQAVIEGNTEVYLRSVAFVQRAVERGGETYRGNAETMRELSEALLKKAQEQQSMLWS
jgi:hypothetical protein